MAHRAANMLFYLQIMIIMMEKSYSENSQIVVVQVDKEARLKCDATDFDEWWHFPVGQGIHRTVSRHQIMNFNYISRFSVNNDSELKIANVHVEDAGEYCCYGDEDGRKTCLVLTVIEKVVCFNNATEDGAVTGADCLGDHPPDVVRHQCHTVYHGTTPPVITWIDAGASQHTTSCFEVRDNVAKCFLTQTATGVADQHSVQCNISSHMCTSSFKHQFAYNATSAFTITQGSIVCTANASGPCSYEWIMVGNETFSRQGQVLDTSSEDILYPGSYVCLANCRIRSQACVVEAMKIDYQPTSQHHRTNAHVGAHNIYYYTGLLGIIVIILGIFVVYRLRNYSKERFKKTFAQLKYNSLKNIIEANDDESSPLLKDPGSNSLESTKLKIRGIAILGDYIYIVGHTSRLIESYNKDTSLKEREIEVKLLDSAWGMAACAKYNCLYVSEHSNRSAALIHKVELNDDGVSFFKLSERFFGAPVNISVTGDHTILVSGGNSSSPAVMEYDLQRVWIREITCPDPTEVHKAVLLKENLVLLAQGWLNDMKTHKIYKMNRENDQIISSYTGDGNWMGIPYDVIVNDEETMVFVACSEKMCVLVLDSHLQIQENRRFNKIKWGFPFRLAFDTGRQVLYVADWHGGIKIVNISSEDISKDTCSVDLPDSEKDEHNHMALQIFNQPIFLRGMAILGNKLYIVATDTRKIEEFLLNSKMAKTSDIVVERLNSAFRMIACEHFNCLYLSEYDNKTITVGSEVRTDKGLVIHKVKFKSDGRYETSQFPISQEYQGNCVNISVTGAHTVLATGDIILKLEEYDTNGSLVREMRLDPTMTRLQMLAVLDDTTILISHSYRGDKHRISDVNPVTGVIRKSYEPDAEYLTDIVVTGGNRFLFVPVADHNHILVLSSKLELIKTIPVGFNYIPFRLAIDEMNGKLYVGSHIKSADILIVDLTKLFGEIDLMPSSRA